MLLKNGQQTNKVLHGEYNVRGEETLGYLNWATRHRYAIEATSAIVGAAGILFIAAGLAISIASLNVASRAQDVASAAFEESKKATQAQTYFAIQVFGFGVLRDVLSDIRFMKYMFEGAESLNEEQLDKVRQNYLLLLTGYNVIFTQRELGYIGESEWELFEKEICGVVTSSGGQDYFQANPIENTTFDGPFKSEVKACMQLD